MPNTCLPPVRDLIATAEYGHYVFKRVVERSGRDPHNDDSLYQLVARRMTSRGPAREFVALSPATTRAEVQGHHAEFKRTAASMIVATRSGAMLVMPPGRMCLNHRRSRPKDVSKLSAGPDW